MAIFSQYQNHHQSSSNSPSLEESLWGQDGLGLASKFNLSPITVPNPPKLELPNSEGPVNPNLFNSIKRSKIFAFTFSENPENSSVGISSSFVLNSSRAWVRRVSESYFDAISSFL